MAGVVKKIPAAEFHIYGSGNMKDDLVELTRSLGLAETVRLFAAGITDCRGHVEGGRGRRAEAGGFLRQ